MKFFSMSRKHLSVRIPIGLTRKPQYKLEYMATLAGWQWRTLLIVTDKYKRRSCAWMVQWQVQHHPIPKLTTFVA